MRRRALANWFLPPLPMAARAAVESFAALLLRPGRVPGGLAAPIRTHLGLDFSRSWALRYARAAALPMTAFLALVAWSLSGVTLLDLDQDAARAGGPAFLLERYLVNLSAALAKSPLMVVDHRQLGADAR